MREEAHSQEATHISHTQGKVEGTAMRRRTHRHEAAWWGVRELVARLGVTRARARATARAKAKARTKAKAKAKETATWTGEGGVAVRG